MNKILAIVIIPIIILFLSFVLGQYIYEIPTGLVTIFSALFGFFGYFNFIIPTETISTVLGYTITLQIILLTFKGGIFLFRFITKSFYN